jgi:hypothetical protein
VIDLENGDRLRSTDGSLLTVVSVRSFTGKQSMWDLTIDGIWVARLETTPLFCECFTVWVTNRSSWFSVVTIDSR